MIICRTVEALKHELDKLKKVKQLIGFVPTMGALHLGHLSLIQLAQKQLVLPVCSIFVNPTQFNDPKDFEKYPITMEKDIYLLEQIGCKILFLPTVAEMYPTGLNNSKTYNLEFIETILEGSSRPGHFNGVCEIVEKLLTIVEPNFLYLGQKDYQQCMVIKKLMEIMGIDEKVELVIGETLREPSGLAMSSRNVRLSNENKQNATSIFKSLEQIKEQIATLPLETIIENTKQHLLKNGFSKVDYVAICNATTLQPVHNYQSNVKYVALIAAFIGEVRLIDNMVLN